MTKNRTLRFLTVTTLALALAGTVSAIDRAKGPEDALLKGTNALEYVRVLTSEEFDSRRTGLEGGLKASAWIADRFKAWGLEPAGTNGYFQDFKQSIKTTLLPQVAAALLEFTVIEQR